MPQHAADILAYAARHDYPDILDIAAPLVVEEETLSETLPKLPLDTMLRWVREKYYPFIALVLMSLLGKILRNRPSETSES